MKANHINSMLNVLPNPQEKELNIKANILNLISMYDEYPDPYMLIKERQLLWVNAYAKKTIDMYSLVLFLNTLSDDVVWGEKALRTDVPIKQSDGSFGIYRVINFPVGEKKDKTIALMLNSLNFEAADQNIKKLNEHIYCLKENERMIRDFYVNICHDLKTPINVISNSLHMITMRNDISDSNSYLSIIGQNCKLLQRLINNIVDKARLDAGCMQLARRQCNIKILLQTLSNSIKPYADEREIEYKTILPSTNLIASIDPNKFERIALNLISNAIKFTGKGGKITTKLSYDKNYIYLTVSDTGIGIPEDCIGTIFERYIQLGNGICSPQNGSGIGLSIVKNMVKLHGGVITVESTLGVGSKFCVKIPNIPCEEQITMENLGSVSQMVEVEFSSLQA